VSSSEKYGRINHYQSFIDELKAQHAQYKHEWKDVDNKLAKNIAGVTLGSGISVLNGQMELKVAGMGLAAFGIKELINSYDKRTKLKRLPVGVFIDLEKKARKIK
jgi:hypothetical protein